MSSRRALAGASAADAGARFERDLLTAHRPAHVSQERPSWLYEDTAPTRALVLCA